MTTKSVRDERKNSTRERLIVVATGLFLTKGFDGATIDEIVEKAGISQRTFFRYFPSKEAIVLRDQPRRRAMYSMILNTDRDRIPPYDRIKKCFTLMADDYEQRLIERQTEYVIASRSTVLNPMTTAVATSVEHDVTRCLRHYRGQTYLAPRQAAMAAAAIVAVLRALLVEWLTTGRRSSLKSRLKALMTFIDAVARAFPPADGARDHAVSAPDQNQFTIN